jgi:hypothetical protein
MNAKLLDRWMNATLFIFNGGSIALVAFDQMFWGAVSGLLAEPAFGYIAWRSKSWATWVLTGWWTLWWSIVAWRNF